MTARDRPRSNILCPQSCKNSALWFHGGDQGVFALIISSTHTGLNRSFLHTCWWCRWKSEAPLTDPMWQEVVSCCFTALTWSLKTLNMCLQTTWCPPVWLDLFQVTSHWSVCERGIDLLLRQTHAWLVTPVHPNPPPPIFDKHLFSIYLIYLVWSMSHLLTWRSRGLWPLTSVSHQGASLLGAAMSSIFILNNVNGLILAELHLNATKY